MVYITKMSPITPAVLSPAAPILPEPIKLKHLSIRFLPESQRLAAKGLLSYSGKTWKVKKAQNIQYSLFNQSTLHSSLNSPPQRRITFSSGTYSYNTMRNMLQVVRRTVTVQSPNAGRSALRPAAATEGRKSAKPSKFSPHRQCIIHLPASQRLLTQ